MRGQLDGNSVFIREAILSFNDHGGYIPNMYIIYLQYFSSSPYRNLIHIIQMEIAFYLENGNFV